MIRRALLTGAAAVLVAPAWSEPTEDDVHAFATEVLNALQPRSITLNREVCGYIYLDDSGNLAATPARTGAEAHCDLDEPDDSVIASYHTHGAFSEDYDNEVPSSDDLMSDFDFGTDGYVATPGGRIWHIDYETERAYLLCGADCVFSDPADDPNATDPIAPSYTLDDIFDREG